MRATQRLASGCRCAALTGFWFGFGYFLTGLYWIAEAFLVEPWRHGWLIPFVMTALPGSMALFYRGGCRACHDAVAPRRAAGFRPRHSLRPRRVRPRSYPYRIALESRGLRAYGDASNNAGGRHFRRLCLEPLGGASLRQSLRHLGAARLRAGAAQSHRAAYARLLHPARARRGMGSGAASERRCGVDRRAPPHRAGQCRSG